MALVGVLFGPTFVLATPELGALIVVTLIAVLMGAVHGAAIGLVAGLGWRVFALMIGPVAYAWVPLIGGNFRTSVAYLIAGCITSGWVFYASRRR